MFEDDLKLAQTTLRGLPSHVDKAQTKAINAATRKALTLAVNDIKSQVNLKSAYIRSKLKISQKATIKKPEGILSAESRGVLLDRFDGQQVVTRSKNIKRSKGDRFRGISAGYKSKGVTVKVKAKGATKFLKGFYIPLKNNTGVNNMGIAVRTGRDKNDYKVLYGPSVGQTFQTVRKDISPMARELLITELLNELELIS